MSQLLNSFNARAQQAQTERAKIATEAAIPRAYFMSETDCYALVQDAIAALKGSSPDPGKFNNAIVHAALGALPENLRDQAIAELRTTIAGKRSLEKAIPFRALDRAIKRAASEISAARNQAGEAMLGVVILDPKAPRECARAFIDNNSVTALSGIKLPLCRYWQGKWYVWKAPRYVPLCKEEMTGIIYTFLEESSELGLQNEAVKIDPDPDMVEDLLHALISLVFIDTPDAMFWLDGTTDHLDPADLIVFQNGTLSISRWLEGKADAFLLPDPGLFVIAALPYAFDPEATCPMFERFLAQVFEGDQHRINALRVYGGYLMTRDTSLQIIMVLLGQSRSGKGTIIRILSALLGPEHVATPKLSSLKGDFGLSALQGKTFAAVTDCHFVGKDAIEAVEVLLAISGEDSVDINRKHRDIVNAIRLMTRFALVMNELVNLPDTAGALLNRLIFMPFNISFVGNEDTGLTKRLIETEMPGIANWFLEGLRVLRHTQNHARSNGLSDGNLVRELLTAPISKEYAQRFRRLSSQIASFVEERCDIGPVFEVTKSTLFDEYQAWRRSNGHHECSSGKFYSDLYAVVPGLEEVRPRGAEGDRSRMLKGIRLKRSAADELHASFVPQGNKP